MRFKAKYKNEPALCPLGHSHRSKLESAVCQVLQLRQRAGEIFLLQVEDHVYLTDARILYIPDFRCMNCKSDEIFFVEAKGYPTPEWNIKKRLWKCYGPGLLEIWGGTHRSPTLLETIVPRILT